MNKIKDHVYVWPIYTRIIHWLIAITFSLSFILSLQENLLNLHAATGITFGLMLFYRIIWGFLGPRYATFNTFKLSIKQLKQYFHEKIINRYRQIPAGHNPASSWFTIIVLSLGSIITITGLLLYGIQEAKGYLGFLNTHFYMYMDTLEIIHKYVSYLLLVWVFIHIAGVLVEQFYHKTNMVFAMITGYKKAKGEDSHPGKPQRWITYIFLFLAIFVYFVSIFDNNNPFVVSKFKKIDYKFTAPIYAKKCGACHNPYPPYMLPTSSWIKIKNGLINHFGEKISPNHPKVKNKITLDEQKIIFDYLFKNSANHSTREISVKVMKSLNGKKGRTSITKFKIWKQIHSSIPYNVFRSKKIKKKSNCFACHKNFEKGIIDDNDIYIP